MATDVTVTITYNATARPPLAITPASADILGQGRATWEINAPGYDVQIVFAAAKCPFPPEGEAPAGTYQSTGSPITTAPARYDTNDTWKYTVTLVDKAKGGASPQPADGAIVIKENP